MKPMDPYLLSLEDVISPINIINDVSLVYH